jgi:carbon storage regulator
LAQSIEVPDMLILTRRIGERLFIGDEVFVTVVGIRGDQVRIGVEAPRSVAVHRRRVVDRIVEECKSIDPPAMPIGHR